MGYFTDSEFECKCHCGKNNIDPDLVILLNEARELAKIPFVVSSGCRCGAHNRKVGGSPNSSHRTGLAADIEAGDSNTRFIIIQSLLQVGFSRIGIGRDFEHVDIDHGKDSMVAWIY